MCLIIHGPGALIRSTLLDTPLLLEEIFKQNGDGLGIMYQSSRGPRVHKWLPKDAAHARRLVQSFMPAQGAIPGGPHQSLLVRKMSRDRRRQALE